ncbi:MAG: SRPBCC domain-containing protein [Pseudomonadales bacterium]|nr:SRPBCC domain-containing protein [Pseudomonadales bacterium]
MKTATSTLFTLIISLSAWSSTYAEVITIAETGFIIENKIQVNTNKATTWQAFSEEVDLWWPKDHSWWGVDSTLSIDSFAGGCFCEIGVEKSAEHMHIVFVDPPNQMRMTGGLGPLQGMGMFGALEFVFNENETGTEVVMTYRVNGINPDGFEQLAPIVDQVQAIQIEGLATLLSTRQ